MVRYARLVFCLALLSSISSAYADEFNPGTPGSGVPSCVDPGPFQINTCTQADAEQLYVKAADDGVVVGAEPSANAIIEDDGANFISFRTPNSFSRGLAFNEGTTPAAASIAHSYNGSTSSIVWTLASSVQATLDSTGDYTLQTGEYVFADSSAAKSNIIRSNTVDTDDDAILALWSGGAQSSSRGAYLLLQGNESSGGGDVVINSGSSSGSTVDVSANAGTGVITYRTGGGTLSATWEADGDLDVERGDVTFSDISANMSRAIYPTTVDGDDDAQIVINGGGSNVGSFSRGGWIEVHGNEDSSGGDININAGGTSNAHVTIGTTNASSTIVFLTGAGNATATMEAAGSFRMDRANQSIYWADSAALQSMQIRAGTADADDDALLCLTGGGACADTARGAFIQIRGNESGAPAGEITIRAGASSGADVVIGTTNANGTVQVETAAGAPAWSFDADGDLTMAVAGACVVFKSPDSSLSECCVDNSDVLKCTGL